VLTLGDPRQTQRDMSHIVERHHHATVAPTPQVSPRQTRLRTILRLRCRHSSSAPTRTAGQHLRQVKQLALRHRLLSALRNPLLAAHLGRVEIVAGNSRASRGSSRSHRAGVPLDLVRLHAAALVSGRHTVRAGQQIGQADARGNAYGCHRHLEVHLRNVGIYGPDNMSPSHWLAAHTG
jgi:hypothetical protein